MKEIQAKNKRKKNGKKPNQFIIPQEAESQYYFSTSEDGENSTNSYIEEIFENKNVENTCNEQNSKINKKQQIKIRENVENYNNSESEENRPPPEPPLTNSKFTRQILLNKNVVECGDQLTMRQDNYVYFVIGSIT